MAGKRAEGEAPTRPKGEWLTDYARDIDNLRAALDWARRRWIDRGGAHRRRGTIARGQRPQKAGRSGACAG